MTAPAVPRSRAGRRSWRWTSESTATVAHYATILVAAALIVYLGRRQWFYFDEWTFLVPRGPGLLTPHSGHLTLLPMLFYVAFRDIFGLQSYWPFLGAAIVAHLVLGHLLWRVMRRARVDAWIATALVLLFLIFAPGAENYLWGFQISFVGAMCFALGAILLITRASVGPIALVGAAVLTAASLATAGTALPLVLAAIVLCLRHRGLRVTVATFAIPVVLYAIWFLTKPNIDEIGTPQTVKDLVTFVPKFAGVMYSDGIGDTLPVPGLGAVLVAGLLLWAVVRAPGFAAVRFSLPLVLLGSGVVFALLTGYSRFALGMVGAESPRYVYVVFATALPAIGSAATTLARRRAGSRWLVVVLAVVVTAYNLGLAISAARIQADREQTSRRDIYAALAFALAHPDDVDDGASADSLYAHALTVDNLLEMHRNGWIDAGRFRHMDTLTARADIAVRTRPGTGGSGCRRVTEHQVVANGETILVRLPSGSNLRVGVVDAQGDSGRYRIVAGARDTVEVSDHSGLRAVIRWSKPTLVCQP